MPVYPGALALASLLAGHGLRKGSLSSSGAIAALTVGYLSLANPVKAFGFTLLLFYLAGSRATKVGHQIKAALEMEFDSGALDKRSHQDGKPKQAGTGQVHKAAAGGQRDAWQVLCNSLLSAVSALIFRLLYEGEWQWKEGKAWCLFEGAPSYAGTSSAAVKAIQHNLGIPAAHLIGPHTPRLLFLIMLGHFSCCMGDTFASELGILAKRPPRLILPPFRIVPPGTNGGLSLQGTLGSALGGTFIGLVAGTIAVLFDNPACTLQGTTLVLQTVVLGTLGGFAGSAIDSFLGATLQRTWYNRASKQVLLGRLPGNADRSAQSEWQVVTGYDVLSNNAVNFISSFTTAVLVAYLGNAMYP